MRGIVETDVGLSVAQNKGPFVCPRLPHLGVFLVTDDVPILIADKR